MGWCSEAFSEDRKTVTRRSMTFKRAKLYTPGTVHRALTKGRHRGGLPIGYLLVERLHLEDISKMPESDYEAEGFQYMEDTGQLVFKKEPREAWEDWIQGGGEFWVIRFKRIEPGGLFG